MTAHPRRTRARPLLLLLLLGIAAIAPGGVAAHAELEETLPAADATVEGSPTEVSATFSEALLADGSSLSLRDAEGAEIAAVITIVFVLLPIGG